MKALHVFLILIISLSAYAKYDIPEDRNVLNNYGQYGSIELPTSFSLLSWNILKAKKADFLNDLKQISAQKELVAIQEFYQEDEFQTYLNSLNIFGTLTATSFIYSSEDKATGVAIQSTAMPSGSSFIRTTNREVIIGTPKVSLTSTYKFKGCDTSLMLINTHAINFVKNTQFFFEMQKISNHIDVHKGPMIWAGDFNTWNKKRLRKLDEITKKLGLVQAKLKDAKFIKAFRGNPLDHIYYRGLKMKKGQVLKNIYSSDHKPLTASFEHDCFKN